MIVRHDGLLSIARHPSAPFFPTPVINPHEWKANVLRISCRSVCCFLSAACAPGMLADALHPLPSLPGAQNTTCDLFRKDQSMKVVHITIPSRIPYSHISLAHLRFLAVLLSISHAFTRESRSAFCPPVSSLRLKLSCTTTTYHLSRSPA
ncbi:hypothetical protein BD309DRAFT_255835 [Dichomitus squalens]|uniref:Uncharacterized protein n=1 Tax=Dichomitus squalens TaxID=114155 RepID=A0A4Q9NK38_9APHY|nr:hypothetical protein BD309DRAFT_255835 [Dichomitus squalens]TBU55438.1 hypothetical protein BD310DRAFT_684512 [Dichomitus squalens]